MSDWTHIQTFVAVVEHGSLSAAARKTGGSQPTMGRHIALLEDSLGVRLFERTASGLEPTPSAIELLGHAQSMREAADRLELAAAGHSSKVTGTIRITASEIVATYLLPDILTTLHQEQPDIQIELVASDRPENLLQREADIAIRMYRPDQADVFTRKVAELPLGVFAAPSYLARRGTPASLDALFTHDFVGFDRNDQIIRGFRQAGYPVDRGFFALRCDNQVVGWRMVVAGFGIGFNQLIIGLNEPGVVQLPIDIELPSLPVWLTAHSELKTSARVRLVYDFLAVQLQGLKPQVPAR